jgi:hypothetical protein
VRGVAGLVVLGLIGALILAVALSGGSGSGSTAVSASGPGNAGCTTDTQSDPGRAHVNNPTYAVNPPAGGDHYPVPSAAGIYTANPPPDGQLVHSLEHGYVIIWFDPATEAADLQNIVAAAQKYPADTLVVPRTGMPAPVAATAWHQRLLCQGLNSKALISFIAEWRNKGPERIPH